MAGTPPAGGAAKTTPALDGEYPVPPLFVTVNPETPRVLVIVTAGSLV